MKPRGMSQQGSRTRIRFPTLWWMPSKVCVGVVIIVVYLRKGVGLYVSTFQHIALKLTSVSRHYLSKILKESRRRQLFPSMKRVWNGALPNRKQCTVFLETAPAAALPGKVTEASYLVLYRIPSLQSNQLISLPVALLVTLPWEKNI